MHFHSDGTSCSFKIEISAVEIFASIFCLNGILFPVLKESNNYISKATCPFRNNVSVIRVTREDPKIFFFFLNVENTDSKNMIWIF